MWKLIALCISSKSAKSYQIPEMRRITELSVFVSHQYLRRIVEEKSLSTLAIAGTGFLFSIIFRYICCYYTLLQLLSWYCVTSGHEKNRAKITPFVYEEPVIAVRGDSLHVHFYLNLCVVSSSLNKELTRLRKCGIGQRVRDVTGVFTLENRQTTIN